MKKRICSWMVILVLLCCVALPTFAQTWSFCPGCGASIQQGYRYCPYCSYSLQGSGSTGTENGYDFYETTLDCYHVSGLTIDNLSTRSGPSTQYEETGTYRVKGQYVPVISLAVDNGGVTWVQCEVEYGGTLHRYYTGLKRFDRETIDFDMVWTECVTDTANIAESRQDLFRDGPGLEYGLSKHKIKARGKVSVICMEGDWAQVELNSSTKWRVWTPVDNLNFCR